MKRIALLLFPVLLLTAQPSMAIREGTATADVFIKRYEQSGDFGRLALWHEAAAECLTRISVPMNEIAHDYYKKHGYEKWAARAEKEAREIQKQHHYHRTRAKTAWRQFSGNAFLLRGFPDQRRGWVSQPVLKAERENIAKFIEMWLPRYPNRFYEFGIYPTFFKKQQELAEQKGDYVKVLHLEADAAEMCAAQYERIPIAYGRRNVMKNFGIRVSSDIRNAQLRENSPQQNPVMRYHREIDRGKQILELRWKHRTVPFSGNNRMLSFRSQNRMGRVKTEL